LTARAGRTIIISGLKRRGRRASAETYLDRGGIMKRLFLLALAVPALVLATQRVMVYEEFTRVQG